MTPRQRVVTHMAKHPRITLRELAVVAGVPLTNVGQRRFAKLIYDLRDDGIVQVTTNKLRSVFERKPAP